MQSWSRQAVLRAGPYVQRSAAADIIDLLLSQTTSSSLTSSSSAAEEEEEEEEEVIITMVAAALKPSATEAEAAAAVLANVSSIGKDEDNSSVDWKSPSTSLLMNRADDWRNEVDDKPLRREMMMKMVKLFNKSKLRQSSAQWRRKLPALVRLIEAAHYRASPTRQAYSETTNLKERVRTLAIAFHSEMKKQGNRTFTVPRLQMEKMSLMPRTPPFTARQA